MIGANLRALEDMAALTAFFEARRGRLFGFRFRDFADFKSCGPGAAPAATDQAIGIGDGATRTFGLVKAYGDPGSSPGQALLRPIIKPVVGSLLVAVDGVPTTAFQLDATTGIVTLAVPPGAGVAVTAGFVFDVPVRFDADRIEVTLESFGAGRIAAVPLVEVPV